MNKFSILLIGYGLLLGSCCSEDFVTPDYDFIEFAIDLTNRSGGCDTPEFTTAGATAVGGASPCLANPVRNRWFKFFSDSDYMYVLVRGESVGGTQRNTIVTIWDTDGTTSQACSYYYGSGDDVTAYAYYLTVGEWYYISVDVADEQDAGSFAICLNPG
jgi:hypothetical protein